MENILVVDHALDAGERGEATLQERVEVAPRVRRLHDDLVAARALPDLIPLGPRDGAPEVDEDVQVAVAGVDRERSLGEMEPDTPDLVARKRPGQSLEPRGDVRLTVAPVADGSVDGRRLGFAARF